MGKRFLLIVFFILFTLIFYGCMAGDNKKGPAEEVQIQEETPGAVEWTDSPKLEMIPSGPVQGVANGTDFFARTVYFEPRFGKWRLVLAEEELFSPTGHLPGGQSINIELPEAPEEGKIYIREMEYGNGYFQIKKQDSEETTSWNAHNAYALEITAWEVDEFDPEKGTFQIAGKASGRIFVVYSGEGWEDFDNSWAAGSFENVNVRYMGEPEWESE